MVPESNEVLKHKRKNNPQQKGCVKGTHKPPEGAPNGQSWNTLGNEIILAYNPTFKINIHVFILIEVVE